MRLTARARRPGRIKKGQTMTRFATMLATALFATPALAGSQTTSLTYEQFEVAVPHLDLAHCPEALTTEGVFCRATLNHDEIHVFAFSEDGDLPMVGFASFPAEGLDALLK